MTLLLLAVIGVVSVAGLSFSPALLERSLLRPYWLLPRRQYATLLTSGFMHADYGHLFFNAFTLWSFGGVVERAVGPARFLALYAVGLVVSDAGTWLRHRHDPSYASLGASGAILAVLFASVVYYPTGSLYIMPLPVPIPAPLFAVGYLAYSWYAARHRRGRVNHDAHFSGALAGLAFVAVTDPGAWRRAFWLLGG
ncbi:MAG: rhomboid family intramembrane serine protease [Gammaproteobacteria bacterium]|nr:rhomboid family intramembrane serine protease [Gammaproteobacteria bacterium]MDE2251197.1 rhomboid family intramembrane serine protease [Gammaproteobacteria bacterium]